MIVAMGFFLFAVAVKYLPIFPKEAVETVSEAYKENLPATGIPELQHAGD
jgi:hypothetical protein